MTGACKLLLQRAVAGSLVGYFFCENNTLSSRGDFLTRPLCISMVRAALRAAEPNEASKSA